MLTATHTRRAVKMIGFVVSDPGYEGAGATVEFDLNNPLSEFSADKLPDVFDAVEILEIIWEDEA